MGRRRFSSILTPVVLSGARGRRGRSETARHGFCDGPSPHPRSEALPEAGPWTSARRHGAPEGRRLRLPLPPLVMRDSGPERTRPNARARTHAPERGRAHAAGARTPTPSRALRPRPPLEAQYWNKSSRYFGSGHSSSATSDSRSSATARRLSCAGMTFSLNALASACTEPASWAAC